MKYLLILFSLFLVITFWLRLLSNSDFNLLLASLALSECFALIRHDLVLLYFLIMFDTGLFDFLRFTSSIIFVALGVNYNNFLIPNTSLNVFSITVSSSINKSFKTWKLIKTYFSEHLIELALFVSCWMSLLCYFYALESQTMMHENLYVLLCSVHMDFSFLEFYF